MGGRLRKFYIIIAILITAMLLNILFVMRLDVQPMKTKNGFEWIRNVEMTTQEDPNAPQGVKETYTISLSGIEGSYRHLVFYSGHQNIQVYYNNELIYNMRPHYKNSYSKTPGCVWNNIVLKDDYNGQTLTIMAIPVYKNVVGNELDFMLGTHSDIGVWALKRDALDLLLSSIAIITGIIFVIYTFFNFKNSEVDKNIALRGIFISMVGLWKLTDTAFLKYMIPNEPIISMLPFIAIMLAIMPFFLFVKEFFIKKESYVWYIICGLSVLEMAMALIFQSIDFMDLRDLFGMSVGIMAIGVTVLFYYVVDEVKNYGWNWRLKRNTVCLAICITGISIDLFGYWIDNSNTHTSFGMVSFLIYALVLAYAAVRDGKALAVEGKKSEAYMEMAYRDQMTGLYNRAAWKMDTDMELNSPVGRAIAVMDLNDLKKCNDTLGHDMGDLYIKDSATLIQEVFGEYGKVYRMGGDEFYCMFDSSTFRTYSELISALQKKIDLYNEISPVVKISIASGYAKFDNRLDYSFNDIVKRADKEMYEDKQRKKTTA